MPCTGHAPNPWDIDPRRWARCQQQAARLMIADGWPPKAKKFHDKQDRIARRLFSV